MQTCSRFPYKPAMETMGSQLAVELLWVGGVQANYLSSEETIHHIKSNAALKLIILAMISTRLPIC